MLSLDLPHSDPRFWKGCKPNFVFTLASGENHLSQQPVPGTRTKVGQASRLTRRSGANPCRGQNSQPGIPARRCPLIRRVLCAPGTIWPQTRETHVLLWPWSGPLQGPLFGLAPDGVFRASTLAPGAVGSYPTFSPLPRPCAQRRGGLFSVALSVGTPLDVAARVYLRGRLLTSAPPGYAASRPLVFGLSSSSLRRKRSSALPKSSARYRRIGEYQAQNRRWRAEHRGTSQLFPPSGPRSSTPRFGRVTSGGATVHRFRGF